MSDFLNENKNFLKLERKLLDIEEKTPISNDAELAVAIKSVIDEEMGLPEEERDFGLIDEAISMILPIIDPKFAELMDLTKKCSDFVAEGIKEENSEDK